MNKIITGFKEVLRVARGEKKPTRVTAYTKCHDCGDVTRVIDGRCEICGANANLGEEV